MSARDLPGDSFRDGSGDVYGEGPLADILANLAGPSSHVDPLARVESGAVVGPGCTIKSGAFIARGTVLRQGVRVDANATFVEPEEDECGTVVDDGARIGAGAVVHAGLHIGAQAVVKPGAVVTHAVPAGATVAGHPAVLVGLAAGATRLMARTTLPGCTPTAQQRADNERLAELE